MCPVGVWGVIVGLKDGKVAAEVSPHHKDHTEKERLDPNRPLGGDEIMHYMHR